jgi:adenylate cyclase
VAEGDGVEHTIGGRTGTPDVFISYASHDTHVADNVAAALEGQGLKCWIAPRDVTPGAHYASEIVHAIDSAKAIILILSKDAATSPHVLREIERATSKRHPVVTLRLDQAPLPAEFEYFLNTSQWLYASRGDTTRVMPKLVAAVRLAIERSAGPAPAISATRAAGTAAFASGALSGVARFRNRTAIAAASIVAVAIAGFAAYRLWLPGHRVIAPAAAVAAGTPAAVTATPAIPEKSVAVLPFVDMSEKKDQEYFSDGMSEELIDMLTKIPDLRVPARTSSFYFKGRPTTISDIAKALGVTYVLEGSVRKSGSVLRVTAQLIRVDTGYHLWSETYDRQLDDVFKVQDDIAGAVVKALKISLMGGALPESAGTQNVEAYNLYLQARAIYVQANSRSDYAREVEYLRKAIDADPQFANAWALLSRVVAAQGQDNYVPAEQALEESRRAANRALELNPLLPDAHTAVAKIYVDDDLDIRRGESQVQQALALDPNNSFSLSWAAWLAAYKGEFDRAIALAQRSIDSDPVNSNRYENLASILYNARRYPEALAAIRKHDDLSPGANEERSLSAFIKLASGDPAGALAAIESDPDLATNCGCRVVALDALGRKPEADLALANLEKNHANDNATGIAKVYASRRDLDQAFKWFDRGYRQHEYELMWIRVDPLIKNVQSDPRFKQLLTKLGLQD